ncbi:hypothetical protein TNCV_4858611 [Trichonephila clavipes]|nr:hypothetical protein TNCV_4858611 [Trichonephila clavipes]
MIPIPLGQKLVDNLVGSSRESRPNSSLTLFQKKAVVAIAVVVSHFSQDLDDLILCDSIPHHHQVTLVKVHDHMAAEHLVVYPQSSPVGVE